MLTPAGPTKTSARHKLRGHQARAMSDETTVTAITNDRPDSCVDVNCQCPTMWSLAQQFCYLRLSNRKGEKSNRLINFFPARARRIAATYARLYLEQEEHGDPRKKGRYYWMALGAFASKTVACSLETLQLSTRAVGDTVRTGLGKGNFWLFNDIAAWHWYHNFDADSFDTCLEKRDVDTYVDKVKEQVHKMPWAGDALPKIKNLRCTPEVKEAFDKVKEFDGASSDVKRRDFQFKNLMALARHEQGNILQPLIYNDSDFAWWVQVQRGGADVGKWTWGHAVGVATSWMAPKLKVAFVAACDTDLPAFADVAPENTKLENYDSRMKWIGLVADKFHGLMIKDPRGMEAQLSTMASWVGTPDSVRYPDETAPAR